MNLANSGLETANGVNTVSQRTLANIFMEWFLTPTIACFIAVALYFAVNLYFIPEI